MNEHCHKCGEEQSIDDAAAIAAQCALIELDPHDEQGELGELRAKARAFLADYLTTRHNRLTAMRMPTL